MTFIVLAGRWLLANPLQACLMAACVALGAAAGWAHAVTIPLLEHEAAAAEESQAKATAALAGANAATAECNASQEELRAQVEQQNQRIADLQAQADASTQRADVAADAAVRKALPMPPADQSAAAVNAYLQSLRSAP
jgi:hypothetical protein